MTPAEHIKRRIAELGDWRGDLYAQLRVLINTTEPALEETWKWDAAVWKRQGLVCAVSSFNDHVKMNFFKGAFLTDPDHMFNSGLDSKQHRSINFAQDDAVDISRLQALIKQAVAQDGVKT